MTEQSEFKYAAFISYNHNPRDIALAELLAAKIESYGLPKQLGAKRKSNRIGRVYRDLDEASAGGSLNDEIKAALAASAKLILVCSPNSLDSRWVSAELDYFLSLGRSKDIIPVISAGAPGEVIPQKVGTFDQNGETDIIAADFRSFDPARNRSAPPRELVRLYAGILDAGYDDLVRRFETSQRSRRRRGALAFVAATLTIMFAGYWIFETQSRALLAQEETLRQKQEAERQQAMAQSSQERASLAAQIADEQRRTAEALKQEEAKRLAEIEARKVVHTKNFASLETRWGVPFGVSEISQEVFDASPHAYRLLIQDGRTIEVRRKERRIPNRTFEFGIFSNQNHFSWKFHYLAGKVEKIEAFTWQGLLETTYFIERINDTELLMRSNFRGAPKRLSTVRTGNRHHFNSSDAPKPNVAQIKLRFGSGGFVEKELFLDARGNLQPNNEGAYGYQYVRDPQGLVQEYYVLDRQEGRIQHDGIARVKLQRAESLVVRQSFWNAESAPMLDHNWCASYHLDRNQSGFVKTTKCMGLDGLPRLNRNGLHSSRRTLDAFGNETSLALFAIDGEIAVSRNRGYHKLTSSYDSSGNRTELRLWGLEGEPVEHQRLGHHLWRAKYDDVTGDRLEFSYFGTADQAILRKDRGYHIWRGEFSDGLLLIERKLGLNGEPILDVEGNHATRFNYSPQGHKVREEYLNERLELSTGTGRFAAHAVRVLGYDENGRNNLRKFFDAKGQPANFADGGYHIWRGQYSETGDLIEERFFDEKDAPKIHDRHGYHLRVAQHDDRGRNIESRFFGVGGESDPIHRERFGHHIWRGTRDQMGRLVRQRYFDKDDVPIDSKQTGAHETRQRFTQFGSVSEIRYFDSLGEPDIHQRFGAHVRRFEYNGNRQKTAEYFYGRKDEPVYYREAGCHAIFTQNHGTTKVNGVDCLYTNEMWVLTDVYDLLAEASEEFENGEWNIGLQLLEEVIGRGTPELGTSAAALLYQQGFPDEALNAVQKIADIEKIQPTKEILERLSLILAFYFSFDVQPAKPDLAGRFFMVRLAAGCTAGECSEFTTANIEAMPRSTKRAVQTELAKFGHFGGARDGIIGSRTLNGISGFAKEHCGEIQRNDCLFDLLKAELRTMQ